MSDIFKTVAHSYLITFTAIFISIELIKYNAQLSCYLSDNPIRINYSANTKPICELVNIFVIIDKIINSPIKNRFLNAAVNEKFIVCQRELHMIVYVVVYTYD
jgi:hypothetical protein